MIRLGSLAGYPFDGPRVLAGWTPPAAAAVYAVTCLPDARAEPQRHAVIYVGHTDDLSTERLPFRHPRAACWIRRAGDRFGLYVCSYQVPGGLPTHREQIARELIAMYHPSCNEQQFDPAWRDEWIGHERTSARLTTDRDPSRPEP